MSNVLPAGQINPKDFQGGSWVSSKIERYGLVPLVLKLKQENVGHTKIAEACNEELRKRKDNIDYYEIIDMNVLNFIRKYYKRKFKTFLETHEGELSEYQDPISMVHEFCQKIKLELDYAQNHRGADGLPADTDKLSKWMELLDNAFNTMRNMYTGVTPAFNVLLFHQNVKKLLAATKARMDITEPQKLRTMWDIKECLLTDQFMTCMRQQLQTEEGS